MSRISNALETLHACKVDRARSCRFGSRSRRLLLILPVLLPASVAALLLAPAGAAAQATAPPAVPGLEPEPGTPPTAIPDIPADEDPMNRVPDPAAGTPAAEGPPRPDGAAGRDPVCRVVPGDTATGLAVACEEQGGDGREGERGGG